MAHSHDPAHDPLPARGRPLDRDAALADLFRAHVRHVERYVRSRIGGRSPDVDDVVHTVFEVALAKLEEVGAMSDGAARRWLIQVARLKSLHHHRERFRRQAVYGRLAAAAAPERDPIAELIDIDLGSRRQILANVRSVLGTLPAAARELLVLDMRGDLNGPQLAELLGIAPTALRVRLLRARRAFAGEYERRFGNPFDELGSNR